MVCEDESTNQKIITRLLSLPGHHVEIAENADEMLDALEVKSFDLVITDLNMAGMNGAEALKLYRFTNPADTNTRFILFTADASLSAKQISIEAGFDAFLTKPIDASTLFITIERILNLAPSTAEQWLSNALHVPTPIKTDLEPCNTALDLNTLNALEKIGVGDALFMQRLLRNFLADAVGLIYKIETAVKHKQLGDLHDFCHALKGNCLSVGAFQLSASTEQIGLITAAVSMTQAIAKLDQLNKDFANLTLAVEDYLRRPVNIKDKLDQAELTTHTVYTN